MQPNRDLLLIYTAGFLRSLGIGLTGVLPRSLPLSRWFLGHTYRLGNRRRLAGRPFESWVAWVWHSFPGFPEFFCLRSSACSMGWGPTTAPLSPRTSYGASGYPRRPPHLGSGLVQLSSGLRSRSGCTRDCFSLLPPTVAGDRSTGVLQGRLRFLRGSQPWEYGSLPLPLAPIEVPPAAAPAWERGHPRQPRQVHGKPGQVLAAAHASQSEFPRNPRSSSPDLRRSRDWIAWEEASSQTLSWLTGSSVDLVSPKPAWARCSSLVIS